MRSHTPSMVSQTTHKEAEESQWCLPGHRLCSRPRPEEVGGAGEDEAQQRESS